jgi:hypothetical protein
MNPFSGYFGYPWAKAIPGERKMFSVTKSLNDHAKSVLVAAGAAAMFGLAALSGSVEASSSPFPAMSGSWAGSGVITMASGTKERLRCRARYDVDGGGAKVDLTLRCASDSFNFELQSNASHLNGAVFGTWAETTRQVSGNLEGSARGNAIHVRVSGVISALLAVNTNANQQSISIQAPGTEMSSVAISLSRK